MNVAPETTAHLLNAAIIVILTWAAVDTIIALVRRKGRDPKEALSNLGVYAISKGWRDFVTRGVEVFVLFGAATLVPWKLPGTWWAFAVTLLATDLAYYWKHRTEHGVRVLWAFHSVHHSSQEYNLTTAFRLPWFGSIIALIFYIPLVLAGMNPLVVILSRQLVLLYQFWIHTESVGKLGWFDRIMNSPSNHRVHHGSNPRYIDRNHGGILIVWDKLFGTYQAELDAEPVRYGLTHPLGTQNPIKVNLAEPFAIIRDVRQAKSWRDAVRFVFGNPGWRPQDAFGRAATSSRK